ncbi:aa3-type cytochrome c oxidase subunit IV [Paracoccus sp. (in: a-proteobacteria)]|uniref:aa3-type cytochrome c oxidase subunit IV n=1 Tax=Paracoccus sp. TaxID=267 RepID=UPI00322003D6
MASHNDITPHKHGEMDIRHHQATFAGFIKVSVWAIVLSIFVLIFMALANA